MKEQRGDRVVDIINERGTRVKKLIVKELKGTKPFRNDPISDDQNLFTYENMSSAMAGDLPAPDDPTYIGDLEYALETYGADAVNEWICSIEKIKQRRHK